MSEIHDLLCILLVMRHQGWMARLGLLGVLVVLVEAV